MAEPDENADFLLLLYGTLMAAVLAGGIAAVATQDPRFAKIVANAVGVLLLAVWLVLPTRAFQPLAAGYTAVVTLVFALVGFVLLHLPGIYAYMLSKRLVESVPRSIQMGALLLWLLALGAVSLLLYSRGLRRAGRAWLERKSGYRLHLDSPGRLPVWGGLALYINFVLIAVGCFAAFSILLHTSGPPLFLPGSNAEVSHGSFADFFLWHLLDAIPGLKVNETIRWTAPLTYERAGAGWLLLLFKVMVIVPAVAGIGRYLKDEDPPKDRPSAVTSGAERTTDRPAMRSPESQ